MIVEVCRFYTFLCFGIYYMSLFSMDITLKKTQVDYGRLAFVNLKVVQGKWSKTRNNAGVIMCYALYYRRRQQIPH